MNLPPNRPTKRTLHRPSAADGLRTAVATAAAALAAAAALMSAAPPAWADDTGDDGTRYAEARDRYEVGHFAIAFAAFARLADEGHCDAARVARQMVRHGRRLYAMDFEVAPERLARWPPAATCTATRTASR